MGSLGGQGHKTIQRIAFFCIGDIKENITNVDFNILNMGTDGSKNISLRIYPLVSFFFFPFFFDFLFSRGRFENKLRKNKHGQMLGCEPSFENVLCLEMNY